MSKVLRGVLVTALALGTLSMPVLAKDAGSDDPVVAKVNGEAIHRSDVMRELQTLGPQAQSMPMDALYPQLLQKMIVTDIVASKGYAAKTQNDAEVKDRVKRAEKQIVADVYLRKTIQPKITEDKIKARYDELATKFKPEDEVRARHILVKTEDEANDILKKLKDGDDFAKLAAEKSTDTGSAKQGGDLGYFPRSAMVKPFADAAFDMKVGEVSSKPVKTDFGYHIIKVEDKRKSAPPPLDEVRDQIVNQIGQSMVADYVKELDDQAKVEKFNLDGSPMKTAAAADAKAAKEPAKGKE